MANYNFIQIDYGAGAQGVTTYVIDLTPSGTVFSIVETSTQNYHGNSWYNYTNGAFSQVNFELPPDLGQGSYVGQPRFSLNGENSAGTIVGYYISTTAHGDAGFIDTPNGPATQVVYPGAISTALLGINDAGTVFGTYSLASDAQTGASHGFVYASGAFRSIDIPGANLTTVTDVEGAVTVGTYFDVSHVQHGFVQNGQSLSSFDAPGATNGTSLSGVTPAGEIVGTFTDASNHSHGFVFQNGAFTQKDFPGATSTTITGVSDSGQLSGNYTDATGTHAFLTSDPIEGLDAVFRFYDTATHDHFYTTSTAEKMQILQTLPTYKLEGVSWATPDKGADTVDVFRFYDTATHDHFFTSSVVERDQVMSTQPTYQYEGVAFQAYYAPGELQPGQVSLERFYNTETKVHHYAANAEEAYGINHGAAGAGWIDEGIGFTVHLPTNDMLIA